MTMTDPIADMLTRIRNGYKAKMKKVDVPASNMKRELARILEEHHFIKKTIEIKDNKQGVLRVYLRYTKHDEPLIRGIRRVSRPGLRKYADKDRLQKMKYQMGMTILSTSRGLLTDEEARREGVGGEALCYVW
ncbi:MAG: 30S ribosomal protein S8 [Candidatus Zixiibacteriota bacterium]|nr:MAG: 30S ribosomal protein S8 [candidate division Zixibacteria bacterium]